MIKPKIKAILSFIILLYVSCGIVTAQSTIPENQSELKSWIDQHFASGKVPPFSFVYGGKNSESFIKNWKFSTEIIQAAEPNTEVSVYTYSDKQSGLVVKCTVTSFTDFPAVEWVVNFINTSGKNSAIIEKAAAINNDFNAPEGGTFILHHAKGSNAERSDFQPYDDRMQIGKNIYMTPSGGRSSDNTALPPGYSIHADWFDGWNPDIRNTWIENCDRVSVDCHAYLLGDGRMLY